MSEYTREEVLEMVKEGKSLEGANLSGIDLSEADLSGTNLKAADLFRANLTKSNLSRTNLYKADLHKAVLHKTNLSFAYLSSADMGKANLSDADIRGTDLSDVILSEADLNNANISGGDLSDANLKRANLSAAVLKNANFASTDLEGATLNNADISGSNIYHIKTPGWKIDNVKCTHVYCYDPFMYEWETETDRKESRRVFCAGEFEAIYKSMPTIELWFREGFSFTDELRRRDIQNRLQKEIPDATISLKKMERFGKDMVITLTVKEEDKVKEVAKAVERLYSDEGLKRKSLRWWKKVSRQFLPGSGNALVGNIESAEKLGSTDIVNNPKTITCNFYGDGNTFVLADTMNNSAIGPGASVNIIQKYENNKTEVDGLLKELRAGLAEDCKALATQMTEALKAGKGAEVKSIWGKITNGIGTTSNMFSIARGIAQLLGLYFSS